jgi:hypothetical protein
MDPGPAIAEADFRPATISADPEKSLAAIFAQIGRDYAGPVLQLKQRGRDGSPIDSRRDALHGDAVPQSGRCSISGQKSSG